MALNISWFSCVLPPPSHEPHMLLILISIWMKFWKWKQCWLLDLQSSQRKVELKKNWSEQLDRSSWSVRNLSELLTAFRSPSVTMFDKHFTVMFTQQLANSEKGEKLNTFLISLRTALIFGKTNVGRSLQVAFFCFHAQYKGNVLYTHILVCMHCVSLILQPLTTPLGPHLTLCCLEIWLDTCLPEQTSWRSGDTCVLYFIVCVQTWFVNMNKQLKRPLDGSLIFI